METPKKAERTFPDLQLNVSQPDREGVHPVLIIQSPKTPTLSRKQKATSLDSSEDAAAAAAATAAVQQTRRDVSSVPNTPKKRPKTPEVDEIGQDFTQKLMLTPLLGSNLRRFSSNTSISGSQTLKTLPEVMTVQECSGNVREPVRIKAKGLLERRGSNASLTIDLGSTNNINKQEQTRTVVKLNTAKSVSNLNLTSFGCEKCADADKTRKKCGNCTIYESVPVRARKHELCKCNLKFLPRLYIERHCVCNLKFRRKSLSNENLYVPPCNFCHFGSKDCFMNRGCNKGSRKALYPRQTYIETSQLLSEDFKLHLQNIQYLQTAGSVLSLAELKTCCQMEKIPRLHQEFWEVPLNLQEKCLVSGSQSRNRYKGVLPNEHSRVILPGVQPYIHANYIKGPDYTETAYIATQGPMAHTCEDFWTMVWFNNVRRIVMLTALVERGRNKCELYFPLGEQGESTSALFSDGVSNLGLIDAGVAGSNPRLFSFDEDPSIDVELRDSQDWGPYAIKFLSKDYLNKCIVRTLELRKNNETRIVYHYWYPNWADHKLANPEQVLKIALHVLDLSASQTPKCTKTTSFESSFQDDSTQKRSQFKTSSSSNKFTFDTELRETSPDPVLVHCSAGIGRTGCFLAILNGIQQLRTNFNVDVLAIVCSLRLNRGGMVQTAEQYELIHRVLSLYADMV